MRAARLFCQIAIRGKLGVEREDWFGGLELHEQADESILLAGTVLDQAALFGILWIIRDLKLALVSVEVKDERCDFHQ